MKVVMIGADRSVHGGVSAMVHNYYQAGLDQRVKLQYIGTVVDGGKGRKLLQAIKAYVSFWRALASMDILHVHMAADASFYRKKVFIDTAAFFRKKILIQEHGGDFQGFYYEKSKERAKRRIRRTLQKADVFVVLSKQWADFFQPLVEPEKIVILENGVPIPKRGKCDFANRNMLFLGRLCKEKGIGELLEVMPKVAEGFPDCRLYLGGIWVEEELRKKAEHLGDMVTWLGWMGEEEKRKYMEKCSLFVLPTYFEGQPVSLLEAMAEGMAVLTTPVGGIPQMIEDGIQGRLIKPGDGEALRKGLEELLGDEALRKQYGQAARKRAETGYAIGERVEKLCRIYDRMK